ncbi:MAG: hypothetical protein L6406_26535, partial [Desulfobacterales bacterium]|nr:hypothetical protein [Desulfobacterales bacterium]
MSAQDAGLLLTMTGQLQQLQHEGAVVSVGDGGFNVSFSGAVGALSGLAQNAQVALNVAASDLGLSAVHMGAILTTANNVTGVNLMADYLAINAVLQDVSHVKFEVHTGYMAGIEL